MNWSDPFHGIDVSQVPHTSWGDPTLTVDDANKFEIECEEMIRRKGVDKMLGLRACTIAHYLRQQLDQMCSIRKGIT